MGSYTKLRDANAVAAKHDALLLKHETPLIAKAAHRLTPAPPRPGPLSLRGP